MGRKEAAVLAGVSEGRLRQLANPCRNDANLIETIFKLDKAAGIAGYGAPIHDLYRSRLIKAGAIEPPSVERRSRALEAVVKTAVSSLRRLSDALEAVLSPGGSLVVPVGVRA